MKRLLEIVSELLTINSEMRSKTIMTTVLTWLLIGMFTLALNVQPVAADDWPMFRHDLSHTGYSTDSAPDTNSLGWSSYALEGSPRSSPAVADGKVYVGSGDDKIYCLNAATGAWIWDYTTGNSVYSSPAVADGKVYVGSNDSNIYCLNAATGALIWDYTTGHYVYSSPAVADGKVYVGSHDERLYCLDADPSDGVDEGYDDPDGVDYDLIWRYHAFFTVSSSPAIADGKVYVGSFINKVFCLDAATGAWIWDYTTGDGVYSSPAVADGKVYVGSHDNKVYCLNAETGAWIWDYTTGDDVWSSPAVADGKVYVGSGDDKIYCLNAATGAWIWDYTTGDEVRSPPALADGKVYVGSLDDKIYCLDAATGALIWNYTTGGDVRYSPAVADGNVYVGSDKVYAFVTESDNDGISDNYDNCPDVPNPDQSDSEAADALAYWKLDDVSGSVADDSMGENDGTLYGDPVWTSGQVNGALDFDGDDDYVDLPDNFPNVEDFTFEAWVYCRSWGGMWQRIFEFGQDTSNYMALCPLGDWPSPNVAGFYTTGGGHLITDSLPTNEWHHIAVTLEEDLGKLYLDGAVVDSGIIIQNPSDVVGANTWLGKSSFAIDPYFYGIMDEVAVYDRALAPARIHTHYLQGMDAHSYAGDGIGDVCDNCPDDSNPYQYNCDDDGQGDVCDPDTIDTDSDGVDDMCDNCSIANPDQLDKYPPGGNGCGDACECEGDVQSASQGVGYPDGDVDGSDAFEFKQNFGRTDCATSPPCLRDHECDGDVDGSDAYKFKVDFGRTDCPDCTFACSY